jgi:hypothetical protein
MVQKRKLAKEAVLILAKLYASERTIQYSVYGVDWKIVAILSLVVARRI